MFAAASRQVNRSHRPEPDRLPLRKLVITKTVWIPCKSRGHQSKVLFTPGGDQRQANYSRQNQSSSTIIHREATLAFGSTRAQPKRKGQNSTRLGQVC